MKITYILTLIFIFQVRSFIMIIKKMNYQNQNMFSGIVEEMGVVNCLEQKELQLWDGSFANGVELTVYCSECLKDSYLGCSISVNGVCLTATKINNNLITFGLAPETLRRTNLGLVNIGSKVNLERALRADGRNSGHFVQGHVDCTGKILDKWNEGDSLWIKVELSKEYLKYIVPKGFICVDGTSLTVCDVNTQSNEGWFTFMLIEHTQKNVIIPSKSIGDLVNIEVDVIAKLVESSLDAFTTRYNDKLNKIETFLKQKYSDYH